MLKAFRENGEKGFTLIELMIVIAIIGILAAIAVPQFALYRKRGYVTSVITDAKNAQLAASNYCAQMPTPTVQPTTVQLEAMGLRMTGNSTIAVSSFTNCLAFTLTITADPSWNLGGGVAIIDQDSKFTQNPTI